MGFVTRKIPALIRYGSPVNTESTKEWGGTKAAFIANLNSLPTAFSLFRGNLLRRKKLPGRKNGAGVRNNSPPGTFRFPVMARKIAIAFALGNAVAEVSNPLPHWMGAGSVGAER